MVINQALYISKSEISSLVTISNVWNFEGDEECFGEDLYCGISMYRDICYLCIWDIGEARHFLRVLSPPHPHEEDNVG